MQIDSTISIIIPVLNEEEIIAHLVRYLLKVDTNHIKEVIVVDGGSDDRSVSEASKAGAIVIEANQTGRAIQMNKGAQKATGDILYFLHADTYPPNNFCLAITNAVQKGYDAGCFRLSFDQNHPLLDFYAWCTRFRFDAFRFGDQSLFVKRDTFQTLGGFDARMDIMEDFEIIKRLKQHYSFILLPQAVTTSARRYQNNGVIKLQLIFIVIFSLYNLGASQSLLKKIYRWLIR